MTTAFGSATRRLRRGAARPPSAAGLSLALLLAAGLSAASGTASAQEEPPPPAEEEVAPQQDGQVSPQQYAQLQEILDKLQAEAHPPPRSMAELAQAFLSRLGVRLGVVVNVAEPGSPGAPPGSGIPDGEELILEVLVADLRFVDSFIAIKQGTGVEVSLPGISNLIGFAIAADETGRASGWFIQEENTFELDLEAGTLFIRGEPRTIPPGAAVLREGELYVHSSVFESWFGIAMDVDFNDLTLTLVPDRPLPVQEQRARIAAFELAELNRVAPPQLPPLELPYRAASVPFVDAQFGARHISPAAGPSSTQWDYSILGNGDLAFATSNYFVAGINGGPLSTLRLTLSREDPAGSLLGPVEATKVEVGDIAAGGFGRGVALTNAPLGLSTSLTTTEFTGDIQPGWDVELYQNGLLIGLVQVGDEGRYEFRNVPLLVGPNEFRLVFYGPQGEVREEVVNRNVTTLGESAGRPLWDAALTQPGLSVYSSTPPAGNVSQAVRLAANVSNRITPQISGSAGFAISDLQANSGRSVGTAVSFPAFAGSMSTNLSYNIDSRIYGLGWGLGRRLEGGQQVSVSQSYPDVLGNLLRSDSQASLSGAVAREGQSEIPYRFSGRYRRDQALTTTTAGASTGIGFGRLSMSLANQWELRDPEEGEATTFLTGTYGLTWSSLPVLLRGGIAYDIIPTAGVNSADGQMTWTIRPRVRTTVKVDRTFAPKSTKVRGSLNLGSDRFNASPSITWGDDGEWVAFVTFGVSAVVDPNIARGEIRSQRVVEQGAVSARVFLDENNNGAYDPGEPPIANARVQAVHVSRGANSDENGLAFLIGLPKNVTTDVVVQPGSLEDPFWTPSVAGRSITPRPGSIHYLEFPIVVTAEIQGIVTVDRPGLVEPRPLAGITVRMVAPDGEAVAEAISAFDGFFLFNSVLPGIYRLEVSEEDASVYGLAAPAPQILDVGQAVVLNANFELRPPGAEPRDVPGHRRSG